MSAYLTAYREDIPAWININLLHEYEQEQEQHYQGRAKWYEDWDTIKAIEELWDLPPVKISDAAGRRDWMKWEEVYIKRHYRYKSQNMLLEMSEDLNRTTQSISHKIRKMKKEGVIPSEN